MLCEHGDISPCVECDIEPLRAENEKLREKVATLVEALSALRGCIMETRGPDAHSALVLADAALSAYHKGEES